MRRSISSRCTASPSPPRPATLCSSNRIPTARKRYKGSTRTASGA